MGHFDHDTLAAYVGGDLARAEVAQVDRHIDTCDSCRRELSALAALVTQRNTRPQQNVTPAQDRLGRYEILGELGHGAIGIVLRAYDPDLARPLAIKLLRHVTPTTRERLRTEAQAMARLRHPNVVTIYDIADEGDVMFVAMELVEGGTLRSFCRGRYPREVLAACMRAGSGLAAAHDAHLVHRDFKPENVLCSDEGEVRVSDFALAGTPAYMAPEIYRCQPATPHSDQFSFCVTTYEMLYGKRPFAGRNLSELSARILGGRPDVPSSTDVPAWIWGVLSRGLATDPRARYPCMHELLAALAEGADSNSQ